MLSMRITGGKYCNRKVLIPEGDLEIRPAMDRTREAVFAILGPLDGMTFCDLFSGSGCIGLEAASRGAKLIHLVELDGKKKEVLEKNIDFAKKEHEIKIFIKDVIRFLEQDENTYDIMYADPPFPMSDKLKIAELADRQDRINEGGLFVIHIPGNEASLWPDKIGKLFLCDTRLYGRNMFKFYRKH